jgi:thiol-disulfide isomerase/thioredoxin
MALGQIKSNPQQITFNSKNKTLIDGKIKNYVPDDNNRFITFRSFNIAGRSKDTSVLIDNDGSFSASLLQNFEGDLAFMFAGNYAVIYAIPGDKLNLTIDASKLKVGNNNAEAIKATGKSADINRLLLRFQLPRDEADGKWQNKALSDSQMVYARKKKMTRDLHFLDEWMRQNSISNKIFRDWAKNHILYQAGWDIAFELYSGSRRSANDQQLIHYLKEIPINNPSARYNSDYYSFLSMLSMSLQIVVNINPAYSSIRKQMGMNAVPVYLAKIDQYATGFAKQLMYFSVYLMNSSAKTEPYLENFNKVVTNPYLRQQIDTRMNDKPFQPFNIVQKLKDYKVHDSLKTRLIGLFESNKKNMFIDFWGSWCSPCMREMPFYSRLIEKFKDENIQFIFFAVETSEAEAQKIKNKYAIDAPFIILSDIETKIMNNVLQFSSYPSHFVIGGDGMVKDGSMPHIDSGNDLSPVAVERIRKNIN